MRRAATAVVLAVGLAACGGGGERPDAPSPPAVEALVRHSAEFRRGVERVTDGVWIAIGYGLANSILVEAPDGLIVIDTLETLEEGRLVAEEFRRVSEKPLRAVIYTHNHADHVFGAQAFLDVLGSPGMPVAVYAHETTTALVRRVVSQFRPILGARAFRMFGTHLDDDGLVNAGIGPRLAMTSESTLGFVEPTKTVRDRLDVEIAGLAVSLVHAPGETDDQLFVWIPDRGVLAPGDNLYKAFPNLYTIRGTPYRSLEAWAESLERMRALPVEHVAPSHTRPIHGRDVVAGVLRDYRDAIRFVHDQTVRWINAGLMPDEIVERVRLPPHLAASPYLQEFYGTVEWSVRSVFTGNLGWFDGNPSTLHPLPPVAEAERIAALAGGREALGRALADAAARGDHQWALQLSDWVLRLSSDDAPARAARIAALEALGAAASNPNARHYYLSSVLELRDGLRFGTDRGRGTASALPSIPMSTVFAGMAVSLRAEDTLDVDTKVGFHFTDTDESWTLWIRRGVVEMHAALLDDLDVQVEVDSLAMKRMLLGLTNPVVALARDFRFPVGNAVRFARTMRHFEPVIDAPVPAPLGSGLESSGGASAPPDDSRPDPSPVT